MGRNLVKNGQIFNLEFSGMPNMIFSKTTIRTTFIPKTRKMHSGVWKLQVKNSQNCQFWKKMALNGPNFAIPGFSQNIEYDFLKEDHKNNFHTKNQEDSQRLLEVIGQKLSKLSILAKILVLNGQNFVISEFSWHIEHDFLKEDHKNNLHTKNQEDLQWRLEVIGPKL